MNILVYADKDHSFENIKPALKGFKYTRINESNESVNLKDINLVICCEVAIRGWKAIYPKIKGKIPILGLQQNIGYSPTPPNNLGNRGFFFDKIMVWGQMGYERYMMCGINEDRIIITGNPKYDNHFNMNTSNEGYLLIIGGQNDFRLNYYTKIIEEMPEYTFIYKNKPGFIEHTNLPNVTCINEGNTTDYIRKSLGVFNMASTCAIEAMIFKKPIVNIACRIPKYVKTKTYVPINLASRTMKKELKNPSDNASFVTYAIGNTGATERVRKVIVETA